MTVPEPTPMMAQWHACKKEAKDALLLFRLGDFYEAFHEDAQIMAKEINLTLTARQGIPMCGVPFHTSDVYIDKLIAKGHKVAVAEQTEDPKMAKGLVKREIVRIVTPGTIVRSQLLSDKKNNFFASIGKIGAVYGLSILDLTTGEFSASELDEEHEVLDELHRIRPAEFLISKKFQEEHPLFFKELSHSFSFLVNTRETLDAKLAREALCHHFDVTNLDPFGFRGKTAAVAAAGALVLYLKEDLNLDLSQITSIQSEILSEYLAIDRATLRHLELTESLSEQGAKNTLLDFLDKTQTPMGGRLLKQWIRHPLLSLDKIRARQDAIAAFLSGDTNEIEQALKEMRDLERLITKIISRHASPRDVLALGLSLAQMPHLKRALLPFRAPLVEEAAQNIFDAEPLGTKILFALSDTPPIRLHEGEIFRTGYNEDLDALRSLLKDSESWMAQYQTRLREESGIKTLKVGYTKAFGYYIEVSRGASDKVPSTFVRRQTLTNGERYITEELKKFEHQALTAEERSRALEAQLFEELREEISHETQKILMAAKAIGAIDVLLALSRVAQESTLARPVLDTSSLLEIKNGRHPMIERSIGHSSFIPNDTVLSETLQMMLITGPNMAGKSTYIRQVALIVILAQMGSFVPAESAHIGLIDKVFSRIGASDDLSRGHSTFMVEMSETANILNHATSRSLVLLDEIGRGTSTYDGIAIAWAVAEYLLTTPKRLAKTLFATHYWELTRLETEFSHAANFQTAVQENASDITFLRKIVRGGTDKSYGIHVAKLAGLPAKAIRRAEEMLLKLEAASPRRPKDVQLSLFSEETLLEELKKIDPNTMTPLAALQKLLEWRNHAL